MDERDERMSTGTFASRTRLSRKALRLYDELGLLRPAEVDPQTGYRSYAPDQVRRARLIGLLRRLDLPLGDIAALLELDPAAAVKALDAHWHGAEQRHAERRRLARYVQDLLTGRDAPVHDIRTREVGEQQVLSTQRNVTVDGLTDFIDAAFPALHGHLAASGVEPAGPGFIVYHGVVTGDSDGPVEICVPFTGSVAPAGTLGVRLEPAHAEAYTRLTKAEVRYPEILGAYEAVDAWLSARRLTSTSSPREVYIADLPTIADDEPACDVAFPFDPVAAA